MANPTLNERLAALAERARRRGRGPESLDRALREDAASARRRGAAPPDLRGRLVAAAERARQRVR